MGGAPQSRRDSRGVGRAPTLAACVLIVLFLAAAFWQYTRMQAKEALQAKLETGTAQAAVDLPRDVGDWSGWRYRRVQLSGRYDAPHQILIDNRTDEGRVGYHVVTPLKLQDGRAVLVDRGFVAQRGPRSNVPEVPVADGDVVVRGRITLPGRYLELGHAAPEGRVWQNLDPGRYAAATGLRVLPIVIEEDADDVRGDGLRRNWPAADLGIDTNRSYMLQWIAFALVVAGLWTWFRFRG